MYTPTRFGIQPIDQILKDRRISRNSLAKAIDEPLPKVVQNIRGITRPRPDLVRKCSEHLDLPLESLFTPEVLSGFLIVVKK